MKQQEAKVLLSNLGIKTPLSKILLKIDTMKILTQKIPNLKMVTMLEFQNINTFLLKYTLQIGQKKFLLLVGLKIQFRGLMLLVT